MRRVLGGILIQDRDLEVEDRSDMQVVTETQPGKREWDDLLFAWRIAHFVHSNAIVLVKDLATVGIGAGQMSRVDAVRIAVEKAETGPAAPSSPRTRSSRSTTARVSPSAPAWQPRSSPAARFATTRSSPRRTRRAPPWSSPAGATSCTERKPQPAAMRLR